MTRQVQNMRTTAIPNQLGMARDAGAVLIYCSAVGEQELDYGNTYVVCSIPLVVAEDFRRVFVSTTVGTFSQFEGGGGVAGDQGYSYEIWERNANLHAPVLGYGQFNSTGAQTAVFDLPIGEYDFGVSIRALVDESPIWCSGASVQLIVGQIVSERTCGVDKWTCV